MSDMIGWWLWLDVIRPTQLNGARGWCDIYSSIVPGSSAASGLRRCTDVHVVAELGPGHGLGLPSGHGNGRCRFKPGAASRKMHGARTRGDTACKKPLTTLYPDVDVISKQP